ncbi:MAG TPA: LLM class F420-dependent oxidoreductase [Chloroflexota bacterium]|nr:LLM class F420-dependent oxidoreductase [Chloroflexota bacterium]
MQIGAVLSQGEVAQDVGALRDYAQAVEGLGYDFLVVSDHVVGSIKEAHPELERVYPIDSFLHESMTVLTFLAGVAPKLGFLTSVVILPQRQTVLAAKQAAEIDVLCGGRFRFGVGIGWNPVEYEALGMDFHNRARRYEEQIKVMRLLWTERTATFKGRYHTLSAAGINPRPVQQPIPIWIGASAEAAVKRATKIADGYLPLSPIQGTDWDGTMDRVTRWLEQAGRSRDSFGIEGRVNAGAGGPDEWAKTAEMWRRYGASHLSVGTGGAGGVDAHVARLRDAKAAIEGA